MIIFNNNVYTQIDRYMDRQIDRYIDRYMNRKTGQIDTELDIVDFNTGLRKNFVI